MTPFSLSLNREVGVRGFSNMLNALVAALAISQAPQQAIIADLGLHVIGVGYQRAFTDRVSVSVSFDLYVPWTFTRLGGSNQSDLAGLVVRARPYFILVAGLWVSPFIQGGVGRVTNPEAFGGVGAAGASVGYAGVLFDHLLLSAGLGVQVHAAWIGASPPSFLGAWPHVDLIAGYTW